MAANPRNGPRYRPAVPPAPAGPAHFELDNDAPPFDQARPNNQPHPRPYNHQPGEPPNDLGQRARIPAAQAAPAAQVAAIANPNHILQPYPVHSSYPSKKMPFASRVKLSNFAPGVPFNVPLGPSEHTHPISHTLRVHAAYNLLDRIIAEFAQNNVHIGKIVDIGGHANYFNRHPSFTNVHVTRPMIDAADYFRQLAPNCCLCKAPAECAACAAPIAYMSIHSLYYLTPTDILQLVNRAPLYAIVHTFDSFDGEIHELNYTREGMNVTMMEPGNPRAYHHSAMDWLYTSNVFTDGLTTMAWQFDTRFDKNNVLKFRIVPNGTLSSRMVYADLSEQAKLLERGLMTRQLTASRLFGANFYIHEKQVVINIQLFMSMVAWWSGKAVTPKTIQDGNGRCAAFASSMDLNISDVTPVLSLVTTLAATAAVDLVMTSVGEIETKRSLIDTYNKYFSGTALETQTYLNRFMEYFRHYPTLTTVIVTSVTVPLVLMVAAPFFRRAIIRAIPSPAQILKKMFMPTPAMIISHRTSWSTYIFALFTIPMAAYQTYKRSTAWSAMIKDAVTVIRNQNPKQLKFLRLGPSPYMFNPSYCAGSFVPPPQDPKSKITLPKEMICNPSIGSVLTGVGFSGWVPRVCRSCAHNEYAAITGRVTLLTPKPTTYVNDMARMHLLPPPGRVAIAFRAWFDALEGPKQRLYARAYEDAPQNWVRATAHKLFVKRENVIRGHDSHPKTLTLTPRAIQTSTPQSNLELGPTVSSYAKALEEINDDDYCFAYTLSPQKLADAFEARVAVMKDPIFVSMDDIKADASTSNRGVDHVADCLDATGCQKGTSTFIRNTKKVKGRSRHGIKYVADKGTPSGQQNTTLNHSQINRSMWKKYRGLPRGSWLVEFKAFIGNKSDDNWIVFENHHNWRQNLDDFIAFRLECGVSVTVTASKHIFASEFLSLRIYRDSIGAFCAPKIGRTMSKLFWSCYPNRIADPMDHVATVCYGLRHLADVPILGPLLQRCFDLSYGAKTTASIDPDKYSHFWEDAYIRRDTMLKAFVEMYDTTYAEILQVEKELTAITTLPFVYTHPLIDKIIAIDLGYLHNPLNILDDAPEEYTMELPNSIYASIPSMLANLGQTRAFIGPVSIMLSYLFLRAAGPAGISTKHDLFTPATMIMSVGILGPLMEECIQWLVPKKYKMVGSTLHAALEAPDVNYNLSMCAKKLLIHTTLGGLRYKYGFGAALAYHVMNNITYCCYDLLFVGPVTAFVHNYLDMLRTSYGPVFDHVFEGTPLPEGLLPPMGTNLAHP